MRPTTAELASRSPRDGGASCQTILAATNKFLAKSNKSQTGVTATKKRIRQKEAVAAALCVLPEDDFAKP